MATRKSTDTTSQNGIAFAGGSSSSAPSTIKDVNYSQMVDPGRALLKNGAYNGHAVEVWADNAVFDTVTGAFLFPGRDYNVNDLQRS